MTARGDRRKRIRNSPDRRTRPRTPGKFKQSEDAAYEALRKLWCGSKGDKK